MTTQSISMQHSTPSALPLSNSPISNNQEQDVPSCSSFFHLWFTQNVHPMVKPKRMFYFFVSQVSFLLAYAAFTQTELYHSYINSCDDHHNVTHQIRPLLFLVAAFGIHTVCLIFLMFFSFLYVTFEKCRYHHLLKSHGEYFVKLLVVFLIVQIGENHYPVEAEQGYHAAPVSASLNSNYYQLAALATACFLTIDAFSVVTLLEASHHYTLLEATITLTLHLGLITAQNYLRVAAEVFVYVTLIVKNYVWRDKDNPEPPHTHETLPGAWVASPLV